ncbi:MAG TPA: hypothetical protein PLK80_13715 [bacterium]|nr:MAG: hypothetical protein BWY28_00081 [bacterium ADurb.Bin236]HOY64168.1 hypothetical protein [bacterium]HPI77784.1 hypothetical protein [bacterium]HPN95564.1 hypothetical protein [bacterium]
MSAIEGGGSAAQITWMAGGLYKSATWLRVMAEAFKSIDENRRPLIEQGPWTARTDSIQRFSRFDSYA